MCIYISALHRYGIPDILVSDNGPQYTSDRFKKFEEDWNFEHVFSSPHYPQSNGKAENAVKTMKRPMTKATESGRDPWLPLLEYRNTPSEVWHQVQHNGWWARGLLPTTTKALKSDIVDERKAITAAKNKQKVYYDHGAKDLPELRPNDLVRIQPLQPGKPWQPAVVKTKVDDRSYDVMTETGTTLRRNRRHLRTTQAASASSQPTPTTKSSKESGATTPESPSTAAAQPKQIHQKQEEIQNKDPSMRHDFVQTRSGRISKLPAYLQDYDITSHII